MTEEAKSVQPSNLMAIEAEAAMWVVRIDGGDLSAKDQLELWDWLTRSSVHRDIFLDYARLWSEFDALKSLVQPTD